MPEAAYGTATRWLTCLTVEDEKFGCDRDAIRLALEAAQIESRPVWKPLHLQPLFAGCEVVGGTVATDLFRRGLCLPSGSSLQPDQLARITQVVTQLHQPTYATVS
jgi:pyridoxal phosphate-dependent aminotransferase EpsN